MLTEHLEHVNDTLVNAAQTALEDTNQITNISSKITEFTKRLDMLEAKLYKAINNTQGNNQTMTNKKSNTKKNVIGPKYCCLNGTHIWYYEGHYCNHEFIVNPYTTRKNCNSKIRKKGHQ